MTRGFVQGSVFPRMHTSSTDPYGVPFVKVYSNADTVELCINDVSLGRISRCECPNNESTVFVWENVKIKPGTRNKIYAKAYFCDGTSKTDYAFWIGE